MREQKMIPLDRLRVDKDNVRRDPAGEEAHNELVASIRAHGLLENLVVTPREDGTHGVVAGGRRYAALKAIHDEDGGDPMEVPCLVAANGDAEELSLAENVVRVAMHPADQMRAFGNLAKNGATAEQIGVRFGLPPRDVKSLLRLGHLPDAIIDDWRDGEVSEDVVYAFATTDDTELAGTLYGQLKKGRQLHAWKVREALDEKRLSADSAIARYVTIEAYRKAGGGVEETLFDRDEIKLTDPQKLTDLAMKKLDRSAKRMEKEGWKWVCAALSFTYQDEDRYEEMPPIPDDHTYEEAARLAEIAKELKEIDASEEAEKLDWNEAWTLRNELRREAMKIERAALKRGAYTDEQKAIAGVVVHIDREGRGKIRRGLVASSEKAAMRKLMRTLQGDEGGDEDGYVAPGAKPKGPYAKAVMDDLRLMRGAAIQRALVDDPRLARDVLAFTLARKSRFAPNNGYEKALLRLDIPHRSDSGGKKLREDECGDAVLQPFEGRAQWDWLQERQRDDAAGLDEQTTAFARFLALPPQARDRVLAHCVADLLIPQLVDEHNTFEHMVRTLDVHFPDRCKEAGIWPWPVIAFWDRLSKAQILDAAKAELGEQWVEANRKLKKGQLVVAASEAFKDCPGWSPEGIEDMTVPEDES